MEAVFSNENKYLTWRKIWLSLAKNEKALGVNIPDEAILSLEQSLKDIRWDRVSYWEGVTRHEVLAHIHAWGEVAPEAKPYIHLGATSCDIMDNADLILMRQGLELLLRKLIAVNHHLCKFALKWKAKRTLGYTHFQSAQLTTVGKRSCLWLQDLDKDFNNLYSICDNLSLRGLKGAVGTSASFQSLISNVKKLESNFAADFDFDDCLIISGQTYSRKIDYEIISTISGIGISAAKMGADLRLLSHLGEVEEPFEKSQVGSSAMPYKRNPMRAERLCSLSRHLVNQANEAAQTAMNQWLERSLDDSAGRRLYIPETFLTADGILNILLNLSSGLVVNEAIIEKNVLEKLPYLLTEKLILKLVDSGMDRQTAHEKIRQVSFSSKESVSSGGEDLFSKLISEDVDLNSAWQSILNSEGSELIGLAETQVASFVESIYIKYKTLPSFNNNLSV